MATSDSLPTLRVAEGNFPIAIVLGFNLWGRGVVPRKCTPRKTGTVLEPCWNLACNLAGTLLQPSWNLACNLAGTLLQPWISTTRVMEWWNPKLGLLEC